jgi:hypothetical protein
MTVSVSHFRILCCSLLPTHPVVYTRPISMNKLHGLQLMRRIKPWRKCMHWISNSAKILVKKSAPSTFFALLVAGTIYLIASSGFTRRTVASSNASRDVPAARASKDSQVATAGGDDRIAVTSGQVGLDANEAHHRAIAENNSAIDQTLAPALAPAPTSAAGHEAFATDREFLERQQPEIDRKDPGRQPREAERKSLERKREEAERKRARLEEMYQRHLISSEAYKKGEEKYKTEIERYRSAVNAGRATKS